MHGTARQVKFEIRRSASGVQGNHCVGESVSSARVGVSCGRARYLHAKHVGQAR